MRDHVDIIRLVFMEVVYIYYELGGIVKKEERATNTKRNEIVKHVLAIIYNPF